MISFIYKLTSYNAFLKGLANILQVEMHDSILSIPEEVGEGFLRAIEFNETDALLYDYALKEDLIIKREKDKAEYYTLIYEEFPKPSNFSVQIGRDILSDSKTRSSAIYLTSF